jgi:hypothetical protein
MLNKQNITANNVFLLCGLPVLQGQDVHTVMHILSLRMGCKKYNIKLKYFRSIFVPLGTICW